MIKNLIALVVAFLTGAIVTHSYWTKVNYRLQRTHQRRLDRQFHQTYQKAYDDGYVNGRLIEGIELTLKNASQN